MLYVRAGLPKTEWIISNVTLGVVLTDEIGLDLIPHYFSISDFMNSRRIVFTIINFGIKPRYS